MSDNRIRTGNHGSYNSWEEKLSQRLAAQKQEETPVVEEPIVEETPVEEPIVEPEPVEEPTPEVVEEPTEEVPVEEPIAEETPVEETPAEEDIYSSWDSEEEPVVEETSTPNTLLEVAKGLGLEGEFESVDQLVQKVNEGREQEPVDVLADVPEELKRAVELAKQGNDYMSYLQVDNVNYDNFSDIDLVANAYEGYFVKDGVIDNEALNNHLDGMTDLQIQIEGDKIRKDLKNHQAQVKAQRASDEAAKRDALMADIDKVLNTVDNVKNFKVSQYQKQKFRGLAESNQLIKELFYTNGKLDAGKLFDTYFKKTNFDKIVGVLETNNRNTGKRDIITKISNPTIPSKTQPPMKTETAEERASPERQQGMWLKGLKDRDRARWEARNS